MHLLGMNHCPLVPVSFADWDKGTETRTETHIPLGGARSACLPGWYVSLSALLPLRGNECPGEPMVFIADGSYFRVVADRSFLRVIADGSFFFVVIADDRPIR